MEKKKRAFASVLFFVAFIVWTLIVCFVDVKEIGPQQTSVGLASLNGRFHEIVGVNVFFYTLTDWLSVIPLAVAFGFAVAGFVQLCKRKSFLKVDRGILFLGAFYIATIFAYLFFEFVVINYRPILIEGQLEASYPSSTTVLVLCVMIPSAIELKIRMEKGVLRAIILSFVALFVAFMLAGRILSGVHWLSDIIGGILLSLGILTSYSNFQLDRRRYHHTKHQNRC